MDKHDERKMMDDNTRLDCIDANLASAEEKIQELKNYLFLAIWRLDETWEQPEVSGDIFSFWPKELQKEYERWEAGAG